MAPSSDDYRVWYSYDVTMCSAWQVVFCLVHLRVPEKQLMSTQLVESQDSGSVVEHACKWCAWHRERSIETK